MTMPAPTMSLKFTMIVNITILMEIYMKPIISLKIHASEMIMDYVIYSKTTKDFRSKQTQELQFSLMMKSSHRRHMMPFQLNF